MAYFSAGNETAVGRHHSPPGKSVNVLEQVTNGPGGPRKACLFGDLAVAHDLTGLEPVQDSNYRFGEGFVHVRRLGLGLLARSPERGELQRRQNHAARYEQHTDPSVEKVVDADLVVE